MVCATGWLLLLGVHALFAPAEGAGGPDGAIAMLVESIPTGLEEALPALAGVGDTASAQIALLEASTQTVDVTVMYWNLLAAGSGPIDPAKLREFGAERGAQLYAAFEAAAARGVAIRILQCRGPSLCSDSEAARLVSKYPSQVSVRYWNATDWYDGGIMHQKLWVGDKSHVYRASPCVLSLSQMEPIVTSSGCTCLRVRAVGSANMDWLSLTQVKELGVVVQHSPMLGADAT